MDASFEPRPAGWRSLPWALVRHWPEYLIEAWGLGLFMFTASAVVTLFEYPGSLVHQSIADPGLRRALTGAAMGLTGMCIVYSPPGQRSGAHLNPAVTLTYWRLGKMHGADALFYVTAQVAGGLAGVLLAALLIGRAFTDPPLHFAVTMPGRGGWPVALAAEFLISGVLMFCVLTVSNMSRWARFTGATAGLLVAVYITIEAPLSGMSMNPARSLASALPAGALHDLWIYFVGPPLGMLTAAGVYLWWRGPQRVACAKFDHSPRQRCIHCGYVPDRMRWASGGTPFARANGALRSRFRIPPSGHSGR